MRNKPVYEAALAETVKHLQYKRLSLEQRVAIMHFVTDLDAFVTRLASLFATFSCQLSLIIYKYI